MSRNGGEADEEKAEDGKKVEEIEHKWLGLFELDGAKKQEAKEDEK